MLIGASLLAKESQCPALSDMKRVALVQAKITPKPSKDVKTPGNRGPFPGLQQLLLLCDLCRTKQYFPLVVIQDNPDMGSSDHLS